MKYTPPIELKDGSVHKDSESGKAMLDNVLPSSTSNFLGSWHRAHHEVQCSLPPPSILQAIYHLTQTLCVYASGMIAQDLPAQKS